MNSANIFLDADFHINKNTTNIDKYVDFLFKQCQKMISMKENKLKMKKTKSLSIHDFFPTIYNYPILLEQNTTISFLKSVIKTNKLKINTHCNKQELLCKVYEYFYYSSHVVIIQKNIRNYLLRKLMKLHGPALYNRNSCINSTDVITMEDIKEIPMDYFYSYEICCPVSRPTSRNPSLGCDNDLSDNENTCSHNMAIPKSEIIIYKQIYGFNITSIYYYVIKKKDFKNPYNREPFPSTIKKDIESFIRLSKIFNKKLNFQMDDDTKHLTAKQQFELHALTIFQHINELDNYSDVTWFLKLSKEKTIQYIRELHDIWNHRADLSSEAKAEICPYDGNLFRNVNVHTIHYEPDIIKIKKIVLIVLERLVCSHASIANRKLGAIFILSALTLVSSDAAEAMPHYYYSVLDH